MCASGVESEKRYEMYLTSLYVFLQTYSILSSYRDVFNAYLTNDDQNFPLQKVFCPPAGQHIIVLCSYLCHNTYDTQNNTTIEYQEWLSCSNTTIQVTILKCWRFSVYTHVHIIVLRTSVHLFIPNNQGKQSPLMAHACVRRDPTCRHPVTLFVNIAAANKNKAPAAATEYRDQIYVWQTGSRHLLWRAQLNDSVEKAHANLQCFRSVRHDASVFTAGRDGVARSPAAGVTLGPPPSPLPPRGSRPGHQRPAAVTRRLWLHDVGNGVTAFARDGREL